MIELSFLIIMFFVFLNILTMIKRIPIFGFVLGIFTFWFGAFYILPETTLLEYRIPMAFFIILVAVINIVVNALEVNQK